MNPEDSGLLGEEQSLAWVQAYNVIVAVVDFIFIWVMYWRLKWRFHEDVNCLIAGTACWAGCIPGYQMFITRAAGCGKICGQRALELSALWVYTERHGHAALVVDSEQLLEQEFISWKLLIPHGGNLPISRGMGGYCSTFLESPECPIGSVIRGLQQWNQSGVSNKGHFLMGKGAVPWMQSCTVLAKWLEGTVISSWCSAICNFCCRILSAKRYSNILLLQYRKDPCCRWCSFLFIQQLRILGRRHGGEDQVDEWHSRCWILAPLGNKSHQPLRRTTEPRGLWGKKNLTASGLWAHRYFAGISLIYCPVWAFWKCCFIS